MMHTAFCSLGKGLIVVVGQLTLKPSRVSTRHYLSWRLCNVQVLFRMEKERFTRYVRFQCWVVIDMFSS